MFRRTDFLRAAAISLIALALTQGAHAADKPYRLGFIVTRNYGQFILLGVLLTVFVIASIFVPYFFTWNNIGNVLQRNSIIGRQRASMSQQS